MNWKTLLVLAMAGPIVLARPAVSESVEPRLAVLLVIDQLQRDRLDAALPGGLGRLVREGRVFANAELAHAVATTCPGHAALASGRHPGRVGLPSNYWADRESGALRYCVDDDAEAAGVLGAITPVGRSPRLLRSDTLGDWLSAARPKARVLSISAKDRAAIVLGGHHPTGAYWLASSQGFDFTTSRYYARELPSWVHSWNGNAPAAGLIARVPEQWRHLPAAAAGVDPRRPDDYPWESDAWIEGASVHQLRGATDAESAARIYRSPFVDALTLDFAAAAAKQLALGEDDVPDLLAVSLSGTDLVGHEFGPESHEARDALLRLDGWLATWLAGLEARVGKGRVVVALSSDHGVLPLPEWLAETERGRCPVGNGRVSLDALRTSLRRHLHWKLGNWFGRRRTWLRHSTLEMTVDRSSASEAGVDVVDIVAAAEAWLEARPEIAAAWTVAELAESADPMAQRYRRSHDPERGGDLIVQPAERCLITRYLAGTTHGAPYDYDLDVPIVFWGAGIRPGRDEREAVTVDVAPTLAALLGVAVPDDLDGVSLLD